MRWPGIPTVAVKDATLFSVLSPMKLSIEQLIQTVDPLRSYIDSQITRVAADVATAQDVANENAQAILQEASDRAAALAAEAQARAAAIAAEAQARLDALTAEAQYRAQAILDEAAARGAAVENEIYLRQLEDQSLASRVEWVSAALTTAEASLTAAISDEATARADADTAEASARTTLAAQMRGSYTGNDLNSVTTGLIYQERTARVTQDNALATQMSLLSAGVGGGFDPYTTYYFDGSAEGWEAAGATLTWVGGWVEVDSSGTTPRIYLTNDISFNGAQYAVVKARIKRTAGSGWMGRLRWKTGSHAFSDTYKVDLADPGIGIGDTVIVEWAAESVPDWISGDVLNIELQFGNDAADTFEVDWIAIGRNAPGASVASLAAEETARATADSAEVTSRETLSTKVIGTTDPNSVANLAALSSGLIYEEKSARSTADATEVSARQLLSTKVIGTTDPNSVANLAALSSGLIYEEKVARVSAVDAVASSLTTLSAQVNDPSTGLAAKAAQTALTALSTTVDGKVDALDFDLLQAEVDDPSTGLSTRASIATVNAIQGDVTGLKARYSLTLDVNGHVTGWVFNNDGATGDFVIVADKFKIARPGYSDATLFSVSGSNVYVGQVLKIGTHFVLDGVANALYQWNAGQTVKLFEVTSAGVTLRDAVGQVLFDTSGGVNAANNAGLGDLATQDVAAPTAALQLNKAFSSGAATALTSDSGEAVLHGLNADGTEEPGVDPVVWWDGRKLTVRRYEEDGHLATLLTSLASKRGFIAYSIGDDNFPMNGATTFNQLTYSEEFNNAVWSKSNVTVTPNAALNHLGLLTADKIEATTSAATSFSRVVSAAGSATGGAYSIYVKKGSGATDANRFYLRNETAATNLVGISFNYDTGAITYLQGGSGGYLAAAEDVGNGWWRIKLTASAGINTSDNLRVYVGFSGNSETAGEYCYADRSMLQVGAAVGGYQMRREAGATRRIAFVYKSGAQWYYDNYTATPVAFTPNANILALGWLETGSADSISGGGLFGHPVNLLQAALPAADVTAENTSADTSTVAGVPAKQILLSQTEIFETFANYTSVSEIPWTITGAANCSLVTTTDSGGWALRCGNNSGNDGVTAICNQALDFTPEDLWMAEVDIEVEFSSSGFMYFGVKAEDNAGNNLTSHNGTYHYQAGSGEAMNFTGRKKYVGYIRGHVGAATNSGYRAATPDNPKPLKNNTVRMKPMFIANYNGQAGQVLIHSFRLRKVIDATPNYRGSWSSSVTYYKDDAVDYQGRRFMALVKHTNTTPPTSETSTSTWLYIGLQPSEAGANVTETRISAGIANQGAFATVNQLTGSNIAALLAAGVISGTYIANAAIQNAHIANLDAGKITTGLLSALRINLNGLMLENQGGQLSIKAGGVDTTQIANNAVSRSARIELSVNRSGISLAPVSGSWYDLETSLGVDLAITLTNVLTSTRVALFMFVRGARTGGDTDTHNFRALRDATALSGQLTESWDGALPRSSGWCFIDDAVPTDGTYTYKIQISRNGDNDGYIYTATLLAIMLSK